ncbi:MAG TPA: hypothetical protein VN920_04280, partial [Pyrinomonadaceae bacterium]|nr:hypothetical protein [Pyrinomonadaceae bacterium]
LKTQIANLNSRISYLKIEIASRLQRVETKIGQLRTCRMPQLAGEQEDAHTTTTIRQLLTQLTAG